LRDLLDLYFLERLFPPVVSPVVDCAAGSSPGAAGSSPGAAACCFDELKKLGNEYQDDVVDCPEVDDEKGHHAPPRLTVLRLFFDTRRVLYLSGICIYMCV